MQNLILVLMIYIEILKCKNNKNNLNKFANNFKSSFRIEDSLNNGNNMNFIAKK